MNTFVTTHYSQNLVILSYVISVIGAFIALSATSRIRAGHPRARVANSLAAGLALGGIGVWSMHFIGMLALRMDLGLGYSMIETGISLVAAVVISTFAFYVVSFNPKSINRLLSAGAMLGVGAAVMHYLGMYGMRFGGYFQWDFNVVGLSVVIALVAATVALWLAFNTRRLATRLLAACVMGIAVCAMHYTGMAAADIICTTDNRRAIPGGFAIVSALQLPILVITLAVGMAVALALDLVFQPSRRATPSHPNPFAPPQ
jgi:NO-binding membrane sensor protein with MHYT domain